MQFVTHPQHTRNLGAPVGWDHSKVHCGSLSVCDHNMNNTRCMESHWKPEHSDAVRLALGGVVALNVYGYGHPPVSMHVEYRQPADRKAYIEQLTAAFKQLLQQAQADNVMVGFTLNTLTVMDMSDAN